MDQAIIAQVAEYYRAGKHEPNHPSYGVFVYETLLQWEYLLDLGYRFTRVDDALTPSADTYKTSAEMFQDIARKQLRIDSAGQSFASGHPLKYQYKDSQFIINECFRGVHDVMGHGSTQCLFETFEGELEALRNHARMYSREAWPALFGETFGQLCHYFAGYGFVPLQRAVVLPDEFISLALTVRG